MADAKAATADNEAEVEDGAEGGAEQAKKKFSLPPMKFLIIGGAALPGARRGRRRRLLRSSPRSPRPRSRRPRSSPTVFVDLPEVLVNLSNTGSERTQYLKIKVVLEVPEQKMVTQITPIMPRVMDAFQTYLRELAPERPRRLGRALPAEGGTDAPRQRLDRAEPHQRGAVQGNRRPVTA